MQATFTKNQQIITSMTCNWRTDEGGGELHDEYAVGSLGVVRIIDVSDYDRACYRVELEDGSATVVFNPNYVHFGAPN